jgi:hypothetical protein
MRERFDHLLLIAMFIAEVLRGIIDVQRSIISFRRKIAEALKKGQSIVGLIWMVLSLEGAEVAMVCAIATVTALYYGSHIPIV